MMYGWLWRRIPGPAWLRAVLLLVVVVALVWVCFEWVFPAVAEHLPINEQTVGE